MTQSEAEAMARSHLARQLELSPTEPPRAFRFHHGALADDCVWFSFNFPNECWIGAGWVIGIKKSDGSMAYFGTDGAE